MHTYQVGDAPFEMQPLGTAVGPALVNSHAFPVVTTAYHPHQHIIASGSLDGTINLHIAAPDQGAAVLL